MTTLTLSYRERRNALSLPLRTSLREALVSTLADEGCHVIQEGRAAFMEKRRPTFKGR